MIIKYLNRVGVIVLVSCMLMVSGCDPAQIQSLMEKYLPEASSILNSGQSTSINKMLNDRETIRIVILSDQKPGHYNQSLGVVENIGNCQYNIINVTFRGKSHDNLLRVATCIFGKYLLPRKIIQLCLRATLSIKTLSEINSIEHVDIILSTGSSVAAINLLLGQLFNAQTVTCRNPSPIGTDFFDLAILPQTSWPKRKKMNLCHWKI